MAKGQPAVGATVVFHSLTDSGPRAMRPHGVVRDDGTFQLTSYTTGDGAPEGEYSVTIVWNAAPKSPLEDVGADRLNGKYVDPKSPFCKVRLNGPSVELEPFVIK